MAKICNRLQNLSRTNIGFFLKNATDCNIFLKFWSRPFQHAGKAGDKYILYYKTPEHFSHNGQPGLKDNPAFSNSIRRKIADAASFPCYLFNLFASNLRSQKTRTFGVIILRFISHFMAFVLAGVGDIAGKKENDLSRIDRKSG